MLKKKKKKKKLNRLVRTCSSRGLVALQCDRRTVTLV